jgi:hypothetical protein
MTEYIRQTNASADVARAAADVNTRPPATFTVRPGVDIRLSRGFPISVGLGLSLGLRSPVSLSVSLAYSVPF